MAKARTGKKAEKKTKLVEANQKALDALPLRSGQWRVAGIPGLYVECLATVKSFIQQRKVDGVPVKKRFGPLTMKEAIRQAMDRWNSIRPVAQNEQVRLGGAVETYIKHKTSMGKMAEATKDLAEYNLAQYLDGWKKRTLDQIGHDRAAIAALHTRLTEGPGKATCNQVIRLLAAVYRWHRDTLYPDLPEWPRKVAPLHDIPARDWAYSEEELKAWWHTTKKEKGGEVIQLGVSTLGAIKKMWWLTALFTGARSGGVEAIRWQDVNLEKRIIHFYMGTDDMYHVPMSDRLAELFTAYRDSGKIPESEWVFPSSRIEGSHLIAVKNDTEGAGPPHRLRHSFKTTLTQLGVTGEWSKLLMGQSLGPGVNEGYLTQRLVVESLRQTTNALAAKYMEIIPALQGEIEW